MWYKAELMNFNQLKTFEICAIVCKIKKYPLHLSLTSYKEFC